MNVSCTTCETVFRVDPAKVPAGGVRARCSVCGGVFRVPGGDGAPLPAAVAAPAPPAPRAAPAPPPPAPRPVIPAAPPAPAAVPVRPPAAAPSPPPPAAPVRPPVAAGAAGAPRRAVNPFLSQDPQVKARRLARALVSDIVVYHPEKRRDGLRDGTLKLLFEEEIQKSWEEYAEQVGAELARSTPYFHEALNEILADGQPIFP